MYYTWVYKACAQQLDLCIIYVWYVVAQHFVYVANIAQLRANMLDTLGLQWSLPCVCNGLRGQTCKIYDKLTSKVFTKVAQVWFVYSKHNAICCIRARLCYSKKVYVLMYDMDWQRTLFTRPCTGFLHSTVRFVFVDALQPVYACKYVCLYVCTFVRMWM